MTKLPFLVALEAKQSKYGLKLIIPIKIKIVTIIKVGESKSLKWCKKKYLSYVVQGDIQSYGSVWNT